MRMRPIVCSSIPFAMMNRRVQESMLKHPQCAQISIAKAPTGLDDLLEDRLQAFCSTPMVASCWLSAWWNQHCGQTLGAQRRARSSLQLS
jgi:hypothetical protein